MTEVNAAASESPPTNAKLRRPGVLVALILELRPKQWVKNFACLAGLIFSGRLFVGGYIVEALQGFAAFCCASSAIYILNDLLAPAWVMHPLPVLGI